MVKIGNRKLAQPEKPVGMSCPLYIQIIAKAERELGAISNQFVDDGAPQQMQVLIAE